jgi:hypothetical protein
LETVNGTSIGEPFQDGSTGLFFANQTAGEMVQAIVAFEQYEHRFRELDMTANAARFSSAEFKSRMTTELQSRCEEFQERARQADRASAVSSW